MKFFKVSTDFGTLPKSTLTVVINLSESAGFLARSLQGGVPCNMPLDGISVLALVASARNSQETEF
jgi:hypothetical protein